VTRLRRLARRIADIADAAIEPVCFGAIGVWVIAAVFALAVTLTGCGAVANDSGTVGIVTNPCAENTRTISCDGDG